DGSWSYTLDANTLDHDGDDATGTADQVQEAFAVRVSDDDGDVSPEATLTLDVNDDGPVASDYGHEAVIDEGSGTSVLAGDAAGALGISGGADGLAGTLG
ncbi:VCBS domain-containing protein, partial [Staphylococcus aureus]|uniref:VCBS domain-containing protein n=1 Tax=Staphylococcus aureus TaxID=1280 RepID=UPI00301C87CC